MAKSRALTGALIVASVAVASVFAAAPANAATLPAGQKITVIDGSSWQFYEASPADAAVTGVGTPAADDQYLTGVDVDDDGFGFAVSRFGGEGSTGFVHTADANTGVLGEGVDVTLDFGDVFPTANDCSAIDYTGGVLIAACTLESEQFEATYVGTLDPVSGVLTPFLELNGEEGFPFLYLTSIALDPISGVLYGFSWDPENGPTAWTLDEVEGATEVTDLDYIAWGADFDRDGQLWITIDIEIGGGEFPPDYSALATLDLTDGSNPFIEPFHVAGVSLSDEVEIDPITVWGKVALPATGLTQSPAVALGAGALLLFGAILAAGTMAVRRRALES